MPVNLSSVALCEGGSSWRRRAVRLRIATTVQQKPLTMFYTYILRSISHPEQRYIGSTSDLKSRLAKHNAGEVPHTSKFKPWKVEAYFAFETKEKAAAFEAYLKTGSGYAFAKRHF